MNLKEEFLFDFAVKMPRILVSGNVAVLDNVVKVRADIGRTDYCF